MKHSCLYKAFVNILAGIMLVSCIFFATSCQNANGDKASNLNLPPVDYSKTDLSKLITLGDYKNITVTAISPEFTDADYQDALDELLNEYADYEKITDRQTSKGDKVVIDYEGYIDGLKVDGICNYEYEVMLDDSSMFNDAVDGFTDNLIGVMPGASLEFDAKFSEDYDGDYAGKDVRFKVKLYHVLGENKVPAKLTNSFVYEITSGEYTNVDDFNTYYKQYFADQRANESKTEVYEKVWDSIINNSKFHRVPKEQVEYYYDKYLESCQTYFDYYKSQGYTFEYFLQSLFGVDTEDELYELCVYYVKQEIAIFSIIKAENITLSEEEYQESYNSYKEDYGENVIKNIIDEYGEEYLYNTFISEKASNMIIEMATVEYEK